MNIKELITKFSYTEFVENLCKIYPSEEYSSEVYLQHTRDAYEEVWKTISECTPLKSDMVVDLANYADEDEDEYYIQVGGTKPDDAVSYSLGWTKWEEIAGMEIDPATLRGYSKLDILTHIIWDITFYGFSQKEIQDEIDRTEAIVKDVEERLM